MNDATVLELAEDNARFRLEQALELVGAGDDAGVRARVTATASYRTLAICRLLREHAIDEFAHLMAKAGHARLDLLQHAGAHPSQRSIGNDLGFGAALTAGDLATAKQIADLAPGSHLAGVEYEDDFLWQRTLQLVLLGRDDEAQVAVTRWREVLDGEPSGQLEACVGLLGDDGVAFSRSFGELIRHRQRQLQRYRGALSFSSERFATEGHVFVDGLAVLRLAGQRGLHGPDEAEMVPAAAIVPLGRSLPPRDAWRQP